MSLDLMLLRERVALGTRPKLRRPLRRAGRAGSTHSVETSASQTSLKDDGSLVVDSTRQVLPSRRTPWTSDGSAGPPSGTDESERRRTDGLHSRRRALTGRARGGNRSEGDAVQLISRQGS